MDMKIIGKKTMRFTSKEGRVIDGTSVYLTYEKDGFEGVIAEKFFIPSVKMKSSDFKVGDILDVTFNRYGKIDSVSLAFGDDSEVEI